ncbi:MAG TPA: hypothetical protein VJ952_04210, partial [Opitutales bacterium]|nr:hypothetical protein [Opitutales bacterium]
MLPSLTGCESEKAASKEDFDAAFRISQEVEFDHHWATVRHLRIRGKGVREVSIGNDARGGVDFSPDGNPENLVTMIFMVDPGKRVASWWITDYSNHSDGGTAGRAGAPRSFTYSDDAKYLSDVFRFVDLE